MKKVLSILFAGCLLLASVATASAAAAYVPPFGGQKNVDRQGVPYITGGVGITERAQMDRMDDGYNLKLIFDVTSGDYLSSVNVKIQNANGKVLLEAVSDGPWFAAQLTPGTYRITADFKGRQQVQTIDLGQHTRDVVMTFAQ